MTHKTKSFQDLKILIEKDENLTRRQKRAMRKQEEQSNYPDEKDTPQYRGINEKEFLEELLNDPFEHLPKHLR